MELLHNLLLLIYHNKHHRTVRTLAFQYLPFTLVLKLNDERDKIIHKVNAGNIYPQ